MANTLRVSIAGIVLASVLGVIVGLMRLTHHALVAWLGSAYVEVFRNTPLLIQLLTIYLLATELLPDSSARSRSRASRCSPSRGCRSRCRPPGAWRCWSPPLPAVLAGLPPSWRPDAG